MPGLAVAAQLAAGKQIPPSTPSSVGSDLFAAQGACKGTTTISTQAEATALASCATYQGDIWIAKGTSEDITLDGIQKLKGSLLAKDVKKMTSLSAEQMSEITDIFGLSDVLALTNLNFPSLVSVDKILWQGLPSLSGLSFTKSVKMANVLNIQNTNLASLDGINLQVIDTLYLANNNFLDEVSMQLGKITNALAMAANGRYLKVEFPNLEWVFSAQFRNVSSLSIPSLASVNASLGFYSNFFDSLKAPNLTTVGGSLSFVSNGALTDISMPELKSLGGGLQIANNTKLMKVDGFPRLTDVSGAIEMLGTFTR